MKHSSVPLLGLAACLVGVHCGAEQPDDPVELGVTQDALTTPNGSNWIVVPRPPARTSFAFSDTYVAPFVAAGWGSSASTTTTTKAEGTSSLAVTVQNAWGAYGIGVSWNETPYSAASQTEVTFAFNAGPTVHAGIASLQVAIDDDDAATPTQYVPLAPYLSTGPVAASTWYRVRIPTSVANPDGRPIRRFLIANRSTQTNVPFWIDDVRLSWTDPAPTVRDVYTDSAAAGFALGGWTVSNVADSFRTTGANSNRASFTGSYGASTFTYDWNQPALAVADYTSVSFDVSAGPGAPPAETSSLRVGLDYAPSKSLVSYLPGGFQANTWHRISIPVAELATGPIRVLTFKNESTASFPLYVDQVRFETDHVPPPLREVPALSLARLEGRWDRSQPTAPRAAYPGARALFRFSGTGLTVRLTEIKSYGSASGTSEWSTRVDGSPAGEVITQSSPTASELSADYVVASGLAAGTHEVELIRRTEAEFGSTRLVNAVVAGGSMLSPPPARSRHIEYVGDSNMTGYGIEAIRPCAHTAANQNWELAFPFLLSTRFGAAVEAAAHSGKGVFYNASRSDLATLGSLYTRSIPSEPASTYAPAQFPADVVVVLAGGNDFAYRDDGDYPSVAQVEGAYDALIGQIRVAHPTASIVTTNSPAISDWYPYYPGTSDSVMVRTKVLTAIQNVVATRRTAGDEALWFFELALVDNDQLTGCDYHPSAALQQTLATQIGNFVASKTGW